jgi:6-phosphogluconolactonase
MAYSANYKDIAEIRLVSSIGELASEFLNILTDLGISDNDSRKAVNIALSGGSTPLKMYEKLRLLQHELVTREKLNFFWGDERCVPPDHMESNYGNAYKTLLQYMNLSDDQIHRIRGENDPDKKSNRYEMILKEKLPMKDGVPFFDLIVLGVGEDGHTASIFPDRLDLFDTNLWVSSAIHPQTQQNRITLTGDVINNAGIILFMALGKEKNKILKDIFNDKKTAFSYPSYHIRPGSGKLIWLCDKPAVNRI